MRYRVEYHMRGWQQEVMALVGTKRQFDTVSPCSSEVLYDFEEEEEEIMGFFILPSFGRISLRRVKRR